MFRSMVDYLQQAIVSLRQPKEAVYSDIYGRPVEHADEFFHPVKFRGIPVFDPDSILSHANYQKQIDRLREVVDIGDHRKTPSGKSLFDELFIEVLKRFITYVHMIPASEDHHHKYTGGLLTHSIEASIESLRWSKELKCQITHMADQDAQIKPILDYAAWLGCLLHDIGKIMRDISVDAVEVIHPFTKLPVPLRNPIVSWYPQKESLTQWAKNNNISAYSVTWLRNRTHNRHNIDSAQILAPLLQGTFAMDYLLSSPIKQELFSELVRCLSGYTQHKGHLSDCIRMGDSVSTNRALQIQYDSARGYRNVSTATKLFQCINHARKEWDWNRPKAQGWVIGNEAYIRWSSAFDSILSTSLDLQYGLPTDTRNILTIMEQNGFAHLFNPECPNDRILKFTPGNFNNDQKKAIISGKQSVTWIDLVKMVTPHVVFGEQPMPPSMAGIIFLPAAKLFFAVNKDGDVSPMQSVEQIDQSATIPENIDEQESLPPPTKKIAQQKTDTTKKASAKQNKPTSITEGFKPSLPKPTQQTNDLNHSLFDNSSVEQPNNSVSENEFAQNDLEKIQERIEPTITSVPTLTETSSGQELPLPSNSMDEQSPTPIETPSIPAPSNKKTTHEKTKKKANRTHKQSEASLEDDMMMEEFGEEPSIDELDRQWNDFLDEDSSAPNPNINAKRVKKPSPETQSVLDKPLVVIPKNIRVSPTLQSILDLKVKLYKTKKDILIDALDAESKFKRPLIEILRELKQANELQLDPMKPSTLTLTLTIDGSEVKCFRLATPLTRLFANLSEGTHNNDQQPSVNESNDTAEMGQPVEISIKDNSSQGHTDIAKSISDDQNKSQMENSEQVEPELKIPSIPAQSSEASTLTLDTLKQCITKEFCHRNNGALFLDIELLADRLNVSVESAFAQLRTIDALHTCPLEPKPEILTLKKSRVTKRFVKLSQIFDALMPARKPPVANEVIEPNETSAPTPVDFINVSLRNFANTAGEKSLVYFLVSKNTEGLIDYLPDGNLVINLRTLNSNAYKPFNQLKIGDALTANGATKQDGIYSISHTNLEHILLEQI